jgi:hypothetical protein
MKQGIFKMIRRFPSHVVGNWIETRTIEFTSSWNLFSVNSNLITDGMKEILVICIY